MLVTLRLSRAISFGCAALVWTTAAIGTARAGSAPYKDTTTGLDHYGDVQVASSGEGTISGPDLPPDITTDNSGGVQVASAGNGGDALLQPPPVDTGRPDLFANPGQGDEALPIGNWLIFSSTFAGAAFATNPNNDPVGGRASPGLLLRTNTLAQNDDGIKKTIIYSNSNAQYYFNQGMGTSSGTSTNNFNTRTGVIEIYQPVLDLIISAQLDFTRQMDYFSSFGVNNNLSTLNSTGVGVAPSANPLPYNQISGSASVQKNFSDAFVILSGSVVDLTYDSSSTTSAPSPNGVTYTDTGRLGYWVMPDLYAYFETSLDKRDYATTALNSSGTALNSSGFRSVAGLGSDHIGLFRGELYGGYQEENYASAAIGGARGPVFGGRGSYFPVPELAINVSLDQTIGASLLTTPTTPTTSTTSPPLTVARSTKVTSLLGQAGYALAPEWTLTGSGGLSSTTYGGINRLDTAYTLGMSVTYSVWRNFGLTFEIQRTALNSNVPQTGFTNNVASLGLSYVY